MEFGTFLLLQSPAAEPPEIVYQRGVEITQAAEDLGFGNMWLAEHHFSSYGYLARPLTYALHLANKTRRIRVGTAVIVVPLHHPLVIAEEIATVDLLTGGRLDVGLGRGYQRYEFERLGQDLTESRSRWEEAVDIIMLGLSGQTFSYDGKYFKIPETTVFPLPVQKPHPPIWVTAQSPDSIETTVRRGFNLMSGGFGVPIERLREFRRIFDAHMAEHPPKHPIRVGTQRPVYVDRQRRRRPRRRRAGPLEHARDAQPAQQLRARRARPRPARALPQRAEHRRSAREVLRDRHAGHVHPPARAAPGRDAHRSLQLQLLVRRADAGPGAEVDADVRRGGHAGVPVNR